MKGVEEVTKREERKGGEEEEARKIASLGRK